jgi:hypothetical protein
VWADRTCSGKVLSDNPLRATLAGAGATGRLLWLQVHEMLSRCIYCHLPLSENQTLENFRVGRRIAFDPGRGRLWTICGSCRRWNLAPIEERWEALEELEKLSRDRGRLLSQTDHIALFRLDDIDIVRVGRAQLAEEAWWRYGQELQRRRARSRLITAAEIALYAGMASVSAFGMMWIGGGGQPIHQLIRWRKFGSTAWRGEKFCRRCGRPLYEVSFKQAAHLIVQPGTAETVSLDLRCKRCGFKNADGGVSFEGPDAERMLRRVLAYHNFSGAPEQRVKDAVRMIDHAGSAHHLIRSLGQRNFKVVDGRKQKESVIALEIAINDEAERELLELELAELEARWREEEELAAIVDGELTELPLLERIRLKLPG